jgi:hypothetical protein
LEQKDFNNQSNYKKINKLTLLSYQKNKKIKKK